MPFPAEAFILAGGVSSRFGSDKARYLLDGKAMILHVADLLRTHFTQLTVIAKTGDDYGDLGLPTVADHYLEQAPICGLLTALQLATAEWLFVAPCDTPYLTAGTLQQLWDGRGERGAVAQDDGGLHPLTAFYHASSLTDFMAAYDRGEYGLQAVAGSDGYAAIQLDDNAALKNFNRPPAV